MDGLKFESLECTVVIIFFVSGIMGFSGLITAFKKKKKTDW